MNKAILTLFYLILSVRFLSKNRFLCSKFVSFTSYRQKAKRMSDYKTILRQCQKRDRRAQLEFYMLFYKSVYNSAYRILGNPQEAEEVMQETFLKVFDRIENYDGEADNMVRILKRIAINQAIDLCRKRKIQFISLEDNICVTTEENNEDETEMQLQLIADKLKQLPEGYRLVLNLHLIEGLKYEEISQMMQLTPSTVRSQFARARNKLIGLIKTPSPHEQFIK